MHLRDRYSLLVKARGSVNLQAMLLEQSRRDIVFWVNTFCWTFDPRLDDPVVPFLLYPYQEWALREWLACMEEGVDIGIEKSRDMGVSWMVMMLFQWAWLFKPGWNLLAGSRKEEYVDKSGDISTLFEKLRFNLARLPKWMRPEGFNPKLHATYMKLLNPANGNTITGETANPNFSRAGRYRGVLFDELAFWPYADASWAAASQSSPCRIANSTPYGKNNKFYDLLHREENQKRHYADLPPPLAIAS